MDAWSYPAVFVPAVLIAVALSFWLMRTANRGAPTFLFDCHVCGRKSRIGLAREWRYCPYCGAARGATSLDELPRRGGKIDANEIHEA